jgi:HTH-type transcriptional regulator/antitoxin MqsA
MRTPQTRIHPETGKTLHRGKRELTVSYRGLTRTVVVAGWFPEDGSDGVMWRGDGDAADAALSELKAEHAARARALADRVARKLAKASARKMTRTALSLLFSGAPNSFAM